jgi:hypothetical protein
VYLVYSTVITSRVRDFCQFFSLYSIYLYLQTLWIFAPFTSSDYKKPLHPVARPWCKALVEETHLCHPHSSQTTTKPHSQHATVWTRTTVWAGLSSVANHTTKLFQYCGFFNIPFIYGIYDCMQLWRLVRLQIWKLIWINLNVKEITLKQISFEAIYRLNSLYF